MPHYFIIGATGQCGLAFAHAALAAGHTLTLYVRTPSKLDPSLNEHESVKVKVGTLTDEAKLREALSGDTHIDGVISFAGPAAGNKGTPLTDGYKVLVPLLETLGIKRFLILSTPSYIVPEDQLTLKWRAVIGLVKIIGGTAYEDITSFSKDIESSSLDYTLFRVPNLTNGEAGPVEATYVGTGRDGLFLSRKSMVKWCLEEFESGKWIRKAPKIANA
ncbi:hypothetical protein BCR39DRAFT_153047 [Naematelia encephala]|uniref:NAD(P)-binding domain-containing protein n=1 Tax=Naematelia encephala TaxID=71784 RepID=A0A1Y2B626_9TREE|nr:hypothetical protein BCR39DRAFT_153047 [Naematelia encephala]